MSGGGGGDSSNSSAAEVDRTIRSLMEEINALEENAIHSPISKPKRKKPEGWTMKKNDVPSDSPSLSWTAKGYQYTVKNPSNCGNILLKFSLFKGGRPTHTCGLYLDEERDSEIYMCLTDLCTRLENLWVNSETGVPKINGINRIATPLPAWRKPCDCATVGGKRKTGGDCIIHGKFKKGKTH